MQVRKSVAPTVLITTLAAVAAAGCGGSTNRAPAQTAAAASSTAPAAKPKHAPVNTNAAVAAARPTRMYKTEIFDPHLQLKIPQGWTANDIDSGAFSVFPGTDEMKSAGELTFDSGTTNRPLRARLAYLRTARGARPGPLEPLHVGPYRGFSFMTHPRKTVTFEDSGFHTNPGETLRVGAFRAGGQTITVFEVVSKGFSARAFHRAIARILPTVKLA